MHGSKCITIHLERENMNAGGTAEEVVADSAAFCAEQHKKVAPIVNRTEDEGQDSFNASTS